MRRNESRVLKDSRVELFIPGSHMVDDSLLAASASACVSDLPDFLSLKVFDFY